MSPGERRQLARIKAWILALPGGVGQAMWRNMGPGITRMVGYGLVDMIGTLAAGYAGQKAEEGLHAVAERVYGEKAKQSFFYSGMVQMEAMSRQLKKTGGFLSQFQKGLGDVGNAHVNEAVHLARHMKDLRQYGISYEDYGKTVTTVAENYMGVVNESFRDRDTRDAIRDHVAIYEELNIGGEVATDAFNFFGTVLAHRSDDVIKATNRMDALARISGQSLGAITKDVLANKAAFVGFMDPDSIIKIGGALQQYGKQLGLGMSTVLPIVEKFDTFESAFETAASLNQVLMRFGTSIDPRKLVGMTPDQRIKELNRVFSGIKGQVMAQGPVVRNLLVGALGDIVGKEEAAALISGKLKEAKVVPETAKLEDFAKKQAKAIVDPMEKLIATIQSVKLKVGADPKLIAKLSTAFSDSSEVLADAWDKAGRGIGQTVVDAYERLVLDAADPKKAAANVKNIRKIVKEEWKKLTGE